MISKYQLKEIINRQIRINGVLETEKLSASAIIELSNIAIKLADEVKKAQDAGGVIL